MRTPHLGFEVSSAPPHQDKNSYTLLWHTGSITYLLLPFSLVSPLIAASAGLDSPTILSSLRAAKLACFCPVVCFTWHKLSSLSQHVQTLLYSSLYLKAAGCLSPPVAPEFCYYPFPVALQFSCATRTRTVAYLSLFPGPGKP